MGIKTFQLTLFLLLEISSEKPPHHMGIKTQPSIRLSAACNSEKPPHHMGIKTFVCAHQRQP